MILNNLFKPIETRRIKLREPKMGDMNDVFDFCSDPRLCRYSDWQEHRSPMDTRKYISWLKKKSRKNDSASFTWFAVYKPDNKVIATVSVVDTDYSGKIFTIGYTFSEKYQHMGLATEAVGALISNLFDIHRAQRVQAYVVPENTPSIRLLERMGMKREGLLRCGVYLKGRCVDAYIYSICQRDYLKIKGIGSVAASHF